MSDHAGCVFCKIVRGELPAAKVLETEHALAVLDIGPLKPGHALLIPRAHHATLPELPDELAAATAALLPRLCRAVKAAARAEGLNVLVNVGPVAGQSVDHVHWHVIPRHAGDRVRWPWEPGRYEGDEMEAMRRAVAGHLGG